MKKLLFFSFSLFLFSCTSTNSNYCTCDYFVNDEDVKSENDDNPLVNEFITPGLKLFKNQPITGTVCWMKSVNKSKYIRRQTTYQNGKKTLRRKFWTDQKTPMEEIKIQDNIETTTNFFINGNTYKVEVKNISDPKRSIKLSSEEYWYNGNLRRKIVYNTDNKIDHDLSVSYNSLGEVR
jgi:hypothetical protein|tara:strand:- start:201 stop:737 length:537 start_codon:yes stop_codon:yes gene_type:complete